jgi:general secretion pathway protein C
MKIAMKRPAINKLDVKLPTKPKRFIAIVLLVVAILASIVYWVLRLRGDDAPPPASVPITASAPPSASVALFGEHPDLLPSAANLSITGVIIAPDPQDSIAIVVESGQRPRALRVGAPVSAGLHLAEVHPRYIVVSDGEHSTRIALPERAAQSDMAELQAPASDVPAAPATPDGGLRGEPPHSSGGPEGEPPGGETTQ